MTIYYVIPRYIPLVWLSYYNILKTYSNLESDAWRVLWIFQINILETLKYAKRNADIHFYNSTLTCIRLFSSSDIHPILLISTCSPFSTTSLSPVKHWNFAKHVSFTAFGWHGEHLHLSNPSPVIRFYCHSLRFE